MSTRTEKAVESFRKGFNCAQSVFSGYAPEMGIDAEDALRISTGFGAGIGRLQEVCGAITGASMVIGCKHGMVRPDDTASKESAYACVRELVRRFKELHGSVLCRELLQCDLRSAEGKKEFSQKHFMDTVCVPCVKDACMIIEEMFAEVGNENP